MKDTFGQRFVRLRKKHGHFTLIDIRSADGDKVIIKV